MVMRLLKSEGKGGIMPSEELREVNRGEEENYEGIRSRTEY